MARIAFVTGATGFLGRNLINSLLRDEWKIIAMHRQNSKIDELKALGVECIAVDMHDASSIADAMPENVDAVFHLAANTTLWRAKHAEQWKDNVDGVKAMCEAALTKHAKKFVFVSSVAAYGYREDIINEDTPQEGSIAPINYCRTKAAAEVEVRAAISKGLQAVIINPAHIVGPHDKTGWIRIIKMIARNELTGIPPGSGSFCYGPFVADAIVSAVDKGQIGHNYLLHGPDAPFLEFVRIASQQLGKEDTRNPLPAFLLRLVGQFNEFVAYFTQNEPEITYEGALMVCQHATIQTTKAKDELGYQQQPLAETIAKTIEWLRSTNQL
ncbi:oxidoreductase [Thraustotheca clavata]|uniref:Oxidoreductase n=1 Tax=Thraustotheca clavata TaxID=74557 RepID=A0A1W0A046_9STRA|nr:oxidoreductase [Thraustotheca clavata]